MTAGLCCCLRSQIYGVYNGVQMHEMYIANWQLNKENVLGLSDGVAAGQCTHVQQTKPATMQNKLHSKGAGQPEALCPEIPCTGSSV